MSNTPAAAVSAPPVHQGDLFEDLGPAVDAGFTTRRRIELDQTSWIEHAPGWLRGSGSLFDELMATAPWEQRDRYIYARRVTEPRLTAEYHDISAAPQQLLHTITATLARHYGVAYRYLWLNLYRTHRDSTSWHGDPIGKIQETSIVPVLSLGATRRFLIKPAGGGQSVSLAVASGDLIVMGGRAQRDWRHSVPKQATPAGPRISINFAPALPRRQPCPDASPAPTLGPGDARGAPGAGPPRPGRPSNGMDGASMLLARRGWSINVAAGRRGV